MPLKKEALAKFHHFIESRNLKHTHQRNLIAEVFFSRAHRHVTIDELLELARKRDLSISYTTVYRTLNLLIEAGLAVSREFGRGHTLFEVALVDHHDHLICQECHKIVEFENETIERMQEEIALKYGFTLRSHRMELYGFCEVCAKKSVAS